MTLFCSTILPTIGRASLARSVESVLAQACPEAFELIVVNDSGQPLAPAAWQSDPRVRLLATARRERCVARNAGAAVARGAFLHFLDDDDWLLPGAFQAFYTTTRQPGAVWYCGASQLHNRQGQPTIRHRPAFAGNIFVQAMAGEWLPMQAALIAAPAFSAAGGFDPLALHAEDNDLLRRLTLLGDVASMESLVAGLVLGEEDSTSDVDLRRENGWRSRENVLDDPRCFARLRASAGDPYWQGRLVRCYLTSAWWNARRRRGAVALSRAVWALAGLALATPGWLAPRFWRAVTRAYASPTFARALVQHQPAR